MIKQVVGNLESKPDVTGIAAVGGSCARVDAPHDAGRLHRIFDQCAGLQPLEPGNRAKVERLAFRAKVQHLATSHAVRP
jgi:hypothetical protein